MTRRPLGRGLDALIESTQFTSDDATGAGNERAAGAAILMLAPDRIAASPLQPRGHFNPQRLSELAAAIRVQGMIEPLIVRRTAATKVGDAPYELVAGERRLRAAREAGLSEVPVIVRELEDRAALELSLVENLLREDLNPIEEGRAFVRLNREFGLTHEQLAERIGKSRPYITNAIRLLELPLPVVEMLARGEISAGQARPLLTLSTADAQIAAAIRIKEEQVSAREAEDFASAQRPSRRAGAAMRNDGDPNLSALAESLRRAFKRKVRIARRRGRLPGRIEFEYYDEADLTALARMLLAASRGDSRTGF